MGYIFIFYHQDTNSIHVIAIPNRQADSILIAWLIIHKLLTYKGHSPNLHILDNECSQHLKYAFTKYNVEYQKIPPTNIKKMQQNV